MLNILFALNGVFNKGGTEAVVLNIYNNIDKNQFHIDFMVHGQDAHDNPIHDSLLSSGASVFYVTPRYISYRQNVDDITSVLSNNHFDIVHSHMDASSYFLIRLAKKQGIKVRVAHSHNTATQFFGARTKIHNILHLLLLEYAKYGLRKEATHFVACSDIAGRWLFGNNICDSSNYLLYKNGIDLEKYLYNENIRKQIRKELGIEDNFVIGHVGRFAKQKNHAFLIDVFKEVYKQYPAAKLLLVGDGELFPQIKAQVYNSDLPHDAVLFTGARDDVNKFYQAMDVMVLPSLFEGLPVTMVEAQASGLKVVASDRVSQEAKLIPETKFLPLEASPQIWAEYVLTFTNGYIRRDTRNEMIDAGYSVTDNIHTLEKFYKNAINM